MLLRERVLAAVLTLGLLSVASALPHSYEDRLHHHLPNFIITNGAIADSYDFVIVGGGAAGLALASRLSESTQFTVLVIEAGKSGDEVMDHISHPLNTYINSTMAIPGYSWAWEVIPQSGAGNRAMSWPGGRVLGGSSATNGLYYTRPSKLEVDTWAGLNSEDSDATKWWSYDSFVTALKRAESFNAPSDTIKQQANIHYEQSSFGNSGPIHVSYPGRTFDPVGRWVDTLANVGIPLNSNPASGVNTGAYISTSVINPSNWTRSYSRSGYIDPLPPRQNLVVLTEATVTRIIWSDTVSADGLVASAVEFASSAEAERKTVKINKEVIITSGPVGSPKLLQLSGIGPKDVLSAVNIPVKEDLPGVGAHLLDHVATSVSWTTNATTPQAAVKAEGTGSPELMSFVNSATAYVSLKTLLGDSVESLKANAVSSYEQAASSLGNSDPTVLAGHKLLYDTTINTFYTSDVGVVEVLLTMIAEGSLLVQAAIQKPLSWGRITIKSNSTFDMPLIDPRYFAHENDRVIMREGAKLARRVGSSAPLHDLLGEETTPGVNATTDEEWDAYLPGSINTEYHQSGTSSMLPRKYGGVVDPRLKVYGTANVRVADSSILPFSLSCHLVSPTYGVAEQAAAIIAANYQASQDPPSGGHTSPPSQPISSKTNGGFYPSYAPSSTLFLWTLVVAFASLF